MPNNPKSDVKPRSIYFYVIVGAALLAFIRTFPLLSPILLSALLILLISLAVNPVISRMRALTGGRKIATGLVMVALVVVIALTGMAFFGPMKTSVATLTEQLPLYWERLQKPLIKMEQQAVLTGEKIQAEVTTEIAQGKMAAGSLKPSNKPPNRLHSKQPRNRDRFVPVWTKRCRAWSAVSPRWHSMRLRFWSCW